MIRAACLALLVALAAKGNPQSTSTGARPQRAALVASPAALCVDSVRDQSGGPCLEASSVPVPGLLFPPPHDGGLNSVVTGLRAFVGGGEGNMATGDQASLAGGSYNFATGLRSAVGGGRGNVASGSRATIAGGEGNRAEANLTTVGGGKNNYARTSHSTIGGGTLNECQGAASTIGGGSYNFAGGTFATIGGGYMVGAHGDYATVGGGEFNGASGTGATVAGGIGNGATGLAAAVPGGQSNLASGDYGFAAGRRAKATHAGSFVWGDSANVDKSSSVGDEFSVYASGGVRLFTSNPPTTGVTLAPGSGTWSSLSDREAKRDVAPVDPARVLEGVLSLPIATWSYRTQAREVRHMGPMAQDFRAAFGLGVGPTTIDGVDPDGVALAAIQGLEARLREALARKDAEIAALHARIEALEARAAEVRDP